MTAIAQMRAKHKSDFQTRNGIKLTYTPFFLKACSDALRAYPYVNASLDGDEILIHHCINIGVAVALEHGLIVPVIKNVQDLSVAGIQKSLTDAGLFNRRSDSGTKGPGSSREGAGDLPDSSKGSGDV